MEYDQAERILEEYFRDGWTHSPVQYPLTLPVDSADPSQMLVPEGDETYVALRYLFDRSEFLTVPGTIRRMSGQVQVAINLRVGNTTQPMRFFVSRMVDFLEGRELKEGSDMLRMWGVTGAREANPPGWYVKELIFGASFERMRPNP